MAVLTQQVFERASVKFAGDFVPPLLVSPRRFLGILTPISVRSIVKYRSFGIPDPKFCACNGKLDCGSPLPRSAPAPFTHAASRRLGLLPPPNARTHAPPARPSPSGCLCSAAPSELVLVEKLPAMLLCPREQVSTPRAAS